MLLTGAPHEGIELEMAQCRAAKARAIALLPFAWWRHESGVQFRATVTKVHAPELVDLLVIPDAYTSLGGRPGEPVPMREIHVGPGHGMCQLDLDP